MTALVSEPNWFYDIPLNYWAVALFALVAVVLVVASIFLWKHRRIGRWVVLGTSVFFVVLTVCTYVLIFYGYFRYVGNVFGVPGQDYRASGLAAAERAAEAGDRPKTGWLFKADIPVTHSGFDTTHAFVYLPPAWFDHPRPELPAMILMHGTPGNSTAWTRSNEADQIADDFAADHDGYAPILIMPHVNRGYAGDSECVDGREGKVETYLTLDVRGWAIDELGVAADPDKWALGGYSEGGFCALMLALRHPDLWRTFLDIGGGAEPSSGDPPSNLHPFVGTEAEKRAQFRAHNPADILAGNTFAELGGWFSAGQKANDVIGDVTTMARSVCDAQAAVVLATIPGDGHTFWAWRRAFENALPWMAARLGIGTFDDNEVPPQGQFVTAGADGRSECGLLKGI